MITFAVEGSEAVPEIIADMSAAHYEEAGVLHGEFNLDINESIYLDNPNLVVFSIRDVIDGLVGYAIYFVHQHQHAQSATVAVCDCVYIRPEYRKGTARDFFQFIEDNLDVDVINTAMNYTNSHMEFMTSLGYEPVEIVYQKVK